MVLQKKILRLLSYSVGLLLLALIAWKEEFYDGTRLRFWDMTATLEKWPICYDKWGIKTFLFASENTSTQGECSKFNYGIFTMPLYKLMAFLSTNEILWTVVLFAACVLLTMYAAPKLWTSHLVFLLVLISPPVTLLFESGNPDLLNLALCLASGVALSKRWIMTFIVTSSIVALHKYYGSAIWIITILRFFREKTLRNFIAWLILIGSAVTIGYQIVIMGLYKFSDAGNNHYGITIWDNYLRKAGYNVNQTLIQVIGIATLVFFAYLLMKIKPLEVSENKKLTMAISSALVIYLVFIFSYITTSNVDYRLTFLGVAVVLDSGHLFSRSWTSRTLMILALASLYMSYPMGYRELIPGLPLQAVGDLILHVVVIYCCARTWSLFQRLRMDLSSNQLRI